MASTLKGANPGNRAKTTLLASLALLLIAGTLYFLLSGGEADGKELSFYPDSTAIYLVRYWPESPNKRFLVYFKTNRSKGYLYEGMPMDEYRAWQEAPSKGRFFHERIKGHYEVRGRLP